jgi:alpha/beta superfamily hydrolase
LRFHHDVEAVAHDRRLKVLALAEHDEFRSPASIVETTATWVNTETEIVGGASHFFVGRTDRLVTVATGLVNRVAG